MKAKVREALTSEEVPAWAVVEEYAGLLLGLDFSRTRRLGTPAMASFSFPGG